MTIPKAKKRICKARPDGIRCRQPVDAKFPPWVVWCSPECGTAMALARQAKTAADCERNQKRAERDKHKADKDRIKTRREWMKDAQTAFNAFIRERDHDLPCICCNEWGEAEPAVGGKWDAGHFMGVGAHPQHRFDEWNCHKQLKSCNAGSGKYARKGYTVAQEYREKLIVRIGLTQVERLETSHEPKKYTIEDLRKIVTHYRREAKFLRTQRERFTQEQAA